MRRWISVAAVVGLGFVALDGAAVRGARGDIQDSKQASGRDGKSACPVTAPAPGAAGHGEVGDDSLMALAPNDGNAVADQLRGGGYHLELWWITDNRARLRFTVQQLDGRGDVTIYDPLGMKRTIGLHSIDLVLSELGCWRITGTRGSTRVAVVLSVASSKNVAAVTECSLPRAAAGWVPPVAHVLCMHAERSDPGCAGGSSRSAGASS
jgi:hypothetical protein